jgi:hypothetical protein
MGNMGALTLGEFAKRAVLTRVSEQSYVEGGTPNITLLDRDRPDEM